MALKQSNGAYKCSVCEKEYPDPMAADSCRESHDMLYIPMTKTEFNRLLNALVLEDLTLIPDSLYKTFRKFQRTQGK